MMRSEEGDRLRDEGIQRAYDAAQAEWKAEALRALRLVVQRREKFTTDALWAYLDRWGVERPREPRAIAGVLAIGKARGWCVLTGDPRVPSVRPEHHSGPLGVWRSLVVGADLGEEPPAPVPAPGPFGGLDPDAVMAAVRSWPPAEQEWWRELLDVAPQEALHVARLAVELGARPL